MYTYCYFFIFKEYDDSSEGENQDEEILVREIKNTSSNRVSMVKDQKLSSVKSKVIESLSNSCQGSTPSLKPINMDVKESNKKSDKGGSNKQIAYQNCDGFKEEPVEMPSTGK